MNTGGVISVVAGISNDRIVLWHYLPKKWNGSVAEACYRGPILRALKKHRGQDGPWKILEDNDPTGFKSSKSMRAKTELGIDTITFPRYSPDLNPLDFSLWDAIEEKLVKSKLCGLETTEQFKARLRRTAMSLPADTVRAAVQDIKVRAKLVYDAKGGNIEKD